MHPLVMAFLAAAAAEGGRRVVGALIDEFKDDGDLERRSTAQFPDPEMEEKLRKDNASLREKLAKLLPDPEMEELRKQWGLARVADDKVRAVAKMMERNPTPDLTVWGFLEEDVQQECRVVYAQFRALIMESLDLSARRRSLIDNQQSDDPADLSEEERRAYNEKTLALNEEGRAFREKWVAWLARYSPLTGRLRAALSSLPPDDEQAAELDVQLRLDESIMSFFRGLEEDISITECDTRLRLHIEGLPPDLLQYYRQQLYRFQTELID